MNGDKIKKDDYDVEAYLNLSFTRRCVFLASVVVAGVLSLFSRAFYLQVSQHDYYSTRSKNNRIRRKSLVPERGNIYDTNGVALTENILRYQVVINPSSVKNLDKLLADITEILPLDEDDILNFKKRYKQTKRYESALLKDSITEEDYYILSVRLLEYPGVEIAPYFQRYYPYGALTTHVVGYTSRISEKDVEKIGRDAMESEYAGIAFIGRTGIEKQYESILKGKPGYQQVETDANANLVRILEEIPAEKGDDIYLSLDVKLQQFVDHEIGDQLGSCVAINPQTGGVIAMVSKPNYDANLFARGITFRQNALLQDSADAPLFDRALRGRYPPGSVIKPAVYLAGLFYNVTNKNKKIYCSGTYLPPNSQTKSSGYQRVFHCWKRSGHGYLNGEEAIEQSCDIYFYTLGYGLGIDRMSNYLGKLGFGRKTGIDLSGESAGLMPTRTWKKERYKKSWLIGDTINTSIGQGYMLTTPLQLATITALIARDGRQFSPYLLKQRYDTKLKKFVSNKLPKEAVFPHYDAYQWKLVKQAMEGVITKGTGRGISRGLQYKMAGKSGTVQVISFKNNERIAAKNQRKEFQDNAMFIAYAPAEKPTIALSVIIEGGGGGSHTAAPIARNIIDYYLLDKDV